MTAPTLVTRELLEYQLRRIEGQAKDAREGVFGPESLEWRVNGESAIFLGAGRALLLQLAHPYVATAVVEHSRVLADPIGRFHRTFQLVFRLVFGTLQQALHAARELHTRHTFITGTLPEDIGPFKTGTLYCANDAQALLWVHATLVETALIAHDLVLPPLSEAERERYYAESCLMAYKCPNVVLGSQRAVTTRAAAPSVRVGVRGDFGRVGARAQRHQASIPLPTLALAARRSVARSAGKDPRPTKPRSADSVL
jgi:uncharacterized protein (DUF2236 family)